jgi:DNA-binding MarR family transcriptional regulator
MAYEFARALEPLELRPPHFGILNLIESHPGCTQQQLVSDSLIDPSSMVSVIDQLEEIGLVERRAHPGDRRKHAVHLTAKGRRQLERARQVAMGMAEEVFSPLSARERETLRRMLRKLAGLEG